MNQHTTIPANPFEATARDIIRDFSAALKHGGHSDPYRYYPNSEFSAGRWIDTAQECIDEDFYGPLEDMMREDGWTMPAESYVPAGAA